MRCDNCDRPLATKQDAQAIPPGEGEHLCWGNCEPEDWRARALTAERERDEARAELSALCSEFEGAVAHADWRAAGSSGMGVPFHGDFASATQLPSVVARMRWWAREMRKATEGLP